MRGLTDMARRAGKHDSYFHVMKIRQPKKLEVIMRLGYEGYRAHVVELRNELAEIHYRLVKNRLLSSFARDVMYPKYFSNPNKVSVFINRHAFSIEPDMTYERMVLCEKIVEEANDYISTKLQAV